MTGIIILCRYNSARLPGKILKEINGKTIQFINGMAANDPVSTLQIWKFILDRYPSESGTCIFFNSRDDRPSRTQQMIELTLRDIKPDHFIVRGDKISSLIERHRHQSPNTKIDIVALDDPIEFLIELFEKVTKDTLVYAIGNQVGAGQKILELISTYRFYG